jgi:hypothetical protein
MSAHLLNNTLSKEMADIAAYYGRGGAPEPLIAELAREVGSGALPYSEALDTLIQDWIQEGGDIDHLEATEERLGRRLETLAARAQEGLDNAPLAIVRPDIHPLVLTALGIEADGILSNDEVNALIAGRRANGEPIEGKKYAVDARQDGFGSLGLRVRG